MNSCSQKLLPHAKHSLRNPPQHCITVPNAAHGRTTIDEANMDIVAVTAIMCKVLCQHKQCVTWRHVLQVACNHTAAKMQQLFSLIGWISDTCSQGYTDLQSLVKCLDHRGAVLVLDTVYVCSQARVVLGCAMHWIALKCILEAIFTVM